jgi:8-oxo-dGTP diphosphatase
MPSQHREISFAIVIDTQDRFLFQQRDDVPGIIAPGKIGMFGGHREAAETSLECVVREVQEETGLALPPENFVHVTSYRGPDVEVQGGWLISECYVVRDVPADRVHVTEGSLLIAERADLASLAPKFAPLALIAIERYLGCSFAMSSMGLGGLHAAGVIGCATFRRGKRDPAGRTWG